LKPLQEFCQVHNHQVLLVPAIYPAFDLYVKSDNKIGWSTYSDEYNAFTMDGIIYEKIGNIHDNPELLENIE